MGASSLTASKLRWFRRMAGLVVVTTLANVGAGVSLADVKRIQDPTDASNSADDIAAIGHHHGPRPGRLLHVIVFDGEPSPPQGISLILRYRKEGGRKVRREVVLKSAPDGSLYGELLDAEGKLVKVVPAVMEDASTLVIEVPVRRLEQPRPVRYRWAVTSQLSAEGPGKPCREEDAGRPPVCRDRAPDTGWLIHQLLVGTFV